MRINKRIFSALTILALLLAVLLPACGPAKDGQIDIASRERIGINSKDDCWIYNGADLILYSDDHSTEKIRLYGDSGNVTVAGALSLTGATGVSSLLDAGNGLEVTGNITQTSGTALLNAVAVTSTLSANTLSTTNAVTVGAGLDIVGALEVTSTATFRAAVDSYAPYVDTSGSFRINDDVLITGTVGSISILTPNTINVVNAVTVGAGLDIVGALEVTSTATFRGAVDSYAPFVDTSGSFRINDSTIITGDLTVSGSASYSSATVVVPFSDTSGSLRMNDDVLITGTLSMAGVINDTGTVVRVDDSLLVTGTITTADYVYAEGYIAAANNDVRILDSVLITGSLAVQGEVSDQGTLFRVNDNSLVTGTLGVSGQATLGSASVTGLTTASNGASVTGGVTVTGYTTATTWAGMGSMYGAISTTVEYTTANSIVLNAVAPKLIVPFTTSGPAADMAGISDGSYIGQLLILKSVETTAGHTLVITQGENVDDTLTLDVDDCAMLFWDGSDWRVISFYDET